MNDVANKPISLLDVNEIVRVASKCTVPPFGHKVIHGRVDLVLRGCKMNVMTHRLEKSSPALPLGIDMLHPHRRRPQGFSNLEEQYPRLVRN